MSIIYALVAREDSTQEYGNNFHVLVEASDSTGNFPQVTRELILKNLPKNQRSIYIYKNNYIFQTINENGFTYLCLTDIGYPKSRSQSFLDEIRDAFVAKYSYDQRSQAISYAMNDSFGPILKRKMDAYNQTKFDPKIDRIRKDAEETLNLMEINLDEVMERGTKIEILVKKSQSFNQDMSSLRQRAEILKERNKTESMKRGIVVIGSVFVFLYFALFH